MKLHVPEIAIEPIGKRVRLMVHLHRVVENCRAGSENVLVSVVVEIEDSRSPRGKARGHGRHTCHLRYIFELAIPQIAIKGEAVTVHRGLKYIRSPVVVDIAEINPHTCNGPAVFVIGYAGRERDIGKCSIAIIVQQEVRKGIVGNKDVGETIAIIVGKCEAHALTRILGNTRLLGYIRERTVTIIPIQKIRRAPIFVGRAIVNDVIRPANMGSGKGIIKIIHYKEVEQAVVVIVKPPRSDRPRLTLSKRTADPSFLRHLRKGTVSVIVEQLISVESSDVQIDKAVIVVVTSGDTHGIAGARQTGLFGDVCESSVSIVAKESVIKGRTAFFQRRNCRSVGKEDIQQTVVVVIEERDAARHCLYRVALRANTILQFEMDIRPVYVVLEDDGRIAGMVRGGRGRGVLRYCGIDRGIGEEGAQGRSRVGAQSVCAQDSQSCYKITSWNCQAYSSPGRPMPRGRFAASVLFDSFNSDSRSPCVPRNSLLR